MILKLMKKVLHPGSRKVGRIAKKATHRGNIEIKGKVCILSQIIQTSQFSNQGWAQPTDTVGREVILVERSFARS